MNLQLLSPPQDWQKQGCGLSQGCWYQILKNAGAACGDADGRCWLHGDVRGTARRETRRDESRCGTMTSTVPSETQGLSKLVAADC